MKTRLILGTLLAAGLAAGTAGAASFFLTQPDSESGLPTGKIYATVTVDVIGDNVQFTVDANADAFTAIGSNFGVQTFWFNTDIALGLGNFSTLPGWTVQLAGGNVDGFGTFSIGRTGTGNNTADPLVFSIIEVTGDSETSYSNPNSNGWWFAAHVKDFTLEGYEAKSAQFAGNDTTGSPVPLPGAAVLLGSGLAGLGLFGRRKNKG